MSDARRKQELDRLAAENTPEKRLERIELAVERVEAVVKHVSRFLTMTDGANATDSGDEVKP